MQRIVIFGNSGSGKSTLARQRAAQLGCPHLDLDTVAWASGTESPTRRAFAHSRAAIDRFTEAGDDWVVEGCYADLLAVALARATGCVFLNPGVEACIENARNRPFEPHKYESKAAQDANLDMLIGWIRDYHRRTDEFSHAAHRRLFEAFDGDKHEYHANLPMP